MRKLGTKSSVQKKDVHNVPFIYVCLSKIEVDALGIEQPQRTRIQRENYEHDMIKSDILLRSIFVQFEIHEMHRKIESDFCFIKMFAYYLYIFTQDHKIYWALNRWC